MACKLHLFNELQQNRPKLFLYQKLWFFDVFCRFYSCLYFDVCVVGCEALNKMFNPGSGSSTYNKYNSLDMYYNIPIQIRL